MFTTTMAARAERRRAPEGFDKLRLNHTINIIQQQVRAAFFGLSVIIKTFVRLPGVKPSFVYTFALSKFWCQCERSIRLNFSLLHRQRGGLQRLGTRETRHEWRDGKILALIYCRHRAPKLCDFRL